MSYIPSGLPFEAPSYSCQAHRSSPRPESCLICELVQSRRNTDRIRGEYSRNILDSAISGRSDLAADLYREREAVTREAYLGNSQDDMDRIFGTGRTSRSSSYFSPNGRFDRSPGVQERSSIREEFYERERELQQQREEREENNYPRRDICDRFRDGYGSSRYSSVWRDDSYISSRYPASRRDEGYGSGGCLSYPRDDDCSSGRYPASRRGDDYGFEGCSSPRGDDDYGSSRYPSSGRDGDGYGSSSRRGSFSLTGYGRSTLYESLRRELDRRDYY